MFLPPSPDLILEPPSSGDRIQDKLRGEIVLLGPSSLEAEAQQWWDAGMGLAWPVLHVTTLSLTDDSKKAMATARIELLRYHAVATTVRRVAWKLERKRRGPDRARGASTAAPPKSPEREALLVIGVGPMAELAAAAVSSLPFAIEAMLLLEPTHSPWPLPAPTPGSEPRNPCRIWGQRSRVRDRLVQRYSIESEEASGSALSIMCSTPVQQWLSQVAARRGANRAPSTQP